MAEALRTRRVPGRPLTAVSIGKVTLSSTSSAANPPASVITTTVGALSSGKTSTGMFLLLSPAKTSSRPAKTTTREDWRREKAMSFASMA